MTVVVLYIVWAATDLIGGIVVVNCPAPADVSFTTTGCPVDEVVKTCVVVALVV